MLQFSALADPTRFQIVELLAPGEMSAGQICNEFTVSAPAISQHLKVLREARLVTVRVRGQQRIYELDPAGFVELDKWRAGIRRFWRERLDQLERDLVSGDNKTTGGETA